jgi:alpha-1,2-mannosyltransferase
MVQAKAGLAAPDRSRQERVPRGKLMLVITAVVLAVSVAAYLADMIAHPRHDLLTWYDLNVYNDAGQIARNSPGRLYTWRLHPGIKFTYTPFAALIFAVTSLIPWTALRWLMTAASAAALAGTVWLEMRALGWRGRRRVAGLFAFTAVALWTEPVQRGLHLGQIELLLMLLIVWDMCQSDQRWWKGAGVGVAAGIKLVPLIFIPYLVLAGKLRQAAVACAAFVASALIGFVFLPHASAKWWLSGYFVHAGNVGDVGSLLNQSVLAVLTRAGGASVASSTLVWLAVLIVIGLPGCAAAALLDRSGRPVAGWVTCALTGLLVSPISWDHHWIWIVPVIVLLTDAGLRSRAAARWAYLALAAGVAAVYGDWPYLHGPLMWVPNGLIGFFVGPHPVLEIYHLHGLQEIGWNLYAVAGLAMFVFALVAAARAWRAGRTAARGDPPGAEAPAT